MLIIVLFLINAAMNFVLSLVLAKFLGPEGFGVYAIAFSAAVVTNVILLDWIRLSATRFYSENTRLNAPEVRATLDVLQAAGSLLVIIITGVLVLSGMELGLATSVVIMTSVSAITISLYDYRTALTRSRFLDRPYAKLILIKNALSLVLMVLGAWYFKDVTIVLAGYVISMAVTLLSVHRVLSDPEARWNLFNAPLAKQYFAYGSHLVVAHGIYQLIPFVNRSVIGVYFGLAEAGFFALASDVGFRLFAALGSSMDMLLFQRAVRRESLEGFQAGQAQVAHNILIILMLIFPACLGYAVVLPVFAEVFVPAAFINAFVNYGTVLAPSLFLLCLVQYGFSPVFQIRHRTMMVSLVALTGLAVNLVGLLILTLVYPASSLALASLQTLSMVVIAFISGVVAYRHAESWPRLRDIFAACLAGLVMVLCLLPLRALDWHPLILLPIMIVTGIVVYGGIVLIFNVGQSASYTLSHLKTFIARKRSS